MNVPTTLPFFNGTQKQASNRDNSPCVIFSPRTQLPPFLIQRPHVANDWVDDIFLVDCEGNETDLQDYFENSIELIVGYSNGASSFQNMDTLTINANNRDITSAIKTTTGAGDAGFYSTATFTVTSGERFYAEIDLTLNSGTAPKVYISDDVGGVLSNEVLLVSGVNHIILIATGTDALGHFLFYNDTADQTNFSATVTLTRTNRPEVHEFTSVDYIQYNGEALIQESDDLVLGWINGDPPGDYGTFTTSGSQITSAISADTAWAKSSAVFPVEVGETYILQITGMTTNSGTTPSMGIYETDFNGDQLSTSNENIFPDGNTNHEFLIEQASSTAVLVIRNLGATNISIDDVELFKKNDLLPKGAYYIKLTDGTNEWFSEWISIQDVYENLISGLANQTYETGIFNGTKVLSAIETGSSGIIFSQPVGPFDVVNDEEITVVFFLTLNSGQLPEIRLIDDDTASNVSNGVNATEGINEITLTATFATTVRLRIFSTAAANFSTSEIWVSRKYSPRFVKLQFSDTKDLHGKRNDDQTILYQESFVQECWLNTILNTPEGNRVDVGEEKNGVFIPEKIITQYKYKIIDYINRSLFEGLIRLPQHDSLTIIDEVGNEYTPDTGNIEISPDWSTFDTATVTILFNDGSFVRTENSEDIT